MTALPARTLTPLPVCDPPGDPAPRALEALQESTAVAGCAHEVQNVLASVYGWVQLARESNDPGLHARALGVIERGIARASALVSVMSDPAERVRVRTAPFHPAAVLSEVYELLHPRCTARSVGLSLSLHGADSEVVALGDATRVSQVLTNFVLNALDATLAARRDRPDAGPIELSLRMQDSEAGITVTDRGTGMDNETRARLFEPFFTTHSSAQGDRAAGTGLGMSITLEFARAMGARVEVDSVVGRGSVLTLWLPRERVSGEILAIPELVGGTRVLVVDDDASIREMLEVALTLRGLRVRVAADLHDARRMITRAEVDVVLVDDNLDGKALGATFLEELRRDFPSVGGVLMTGATEVDPEALGCENYLRKPFLLDDVVRVLAQATLRAPRAAPGV